tara:strand:+ start:245 stop:1279 length:1035 start_codon:yes stop_codon:yes gene_type:complete
MSTKKNPKSKNKLNDATKSSDSNNFVDLLDEDKPISGQKYVCLSFISPEEIIKNKNLFLFEKFLENFEFRKSMEKYRQFLSFISYKYNINFDKLDSDLEEFIREEKSNLITTTMEDEYKNFIDATEEKLNNEFNTMNNFQTSTRGIKVRGVFETQEEAEIKCKLLREIDSNHDVYVGQVGIWLPFHPEAYKTGRVEYLEKELNDLMTQKKKNDEVSKENFKQRVKESKQKAIEENIEKAEKEGNKLLQSIDEDGNLVNSDTSKIFEEMTSVLNDTENISTANLKKELMEDDTIILPDKKDNDHGLSELIVRQKELEKIAAEADGMESVSEPPTTTNTNNIINVE